MAIDFGSCYSSFKADGSKGLTYRRITGPRVPLERVARRLLGDKGTNLWAKNMGIDVQKLENSDPTTTDLQHWAAFARGEALQVEHVVAAAFAFTLDAAGTVTVDGQILLGDGATYPLQVTAGNAAKALFPVS